MGPQNGIMGSNPSEFPEIDLPQQQVDDTQINEMRNMVKFSKTAEFKNLRKYIEGRIKFYQTYLPNGKAVGANEDPVNMGQMWIASNVIIGELQSLLDQYDQAAEFVKQVKRESTGR